MLKIRLQRVGRTHEPAYRLVLTDSKNSTKSGRYLESLGSYDARRGEKSEFKADKIKAWIGKGAQLSGTVHNLLISKKIIEGKNSSDRTQEREEFRMLIDINDFQKKKVDSVKATAHMMAERARYFKSNIEIDPMSAFERRVIHEFLSDATDLKTESMGEGPTRRVVIKYVGQI